MKPLPSGPTPEQVQKRKQGISSFGAKVNPVGGVTADFGLGYPYYFTARLTVGAFNVKPLGMASASSSRPSSTSTTGCSRPASAGGDRPACGGGPGRHRRRYRHQRPGHRLRRRVGGRVAGLRQRRDLLPDRPVDSLWLGLSSAPAKPRRATGSTEEVLLRGRCPRFSATIPPTTSRVTASTWGLKTVAALDRFTSVFLKIEFLPFADQFSFKPRMGFQDAVQQLALRQGHLRLRDGRHRAEVLTQGAFSGPRPVPEMPPVLVCVAVVNFRWRSG